MCGGVLCTGIVLAAVKVLHEAFTANEVDANLWGLDKKQVSVTLQLHLHAIAYQH